MKCFIAVFLLAFVAVVMAVEKTPEAGKTTETTTDVGRDKRGFGYYSPYAYSSYGPYAYSAYNYPYGYAPYSYPYARHHYPYYNNPYHYY